MNTLNYKKGLIKQYFYSQVQQLNFIILPKLLLLLLINGVFSAPLMAEGTKELAPNSTDITALYTNSTSNGSFAQYNGPTDSRLNFHIADPNNEQVFLGFSQQMTISNGSDGNFLAPAFYFRIKDANGNIVFGPQMVDASNANTNTWALAAAGPAPIVGASGYTPFTFNPAGLSAGDYYIEFSLSPTARSFNGTSPSEYVAIKFWDITVATKGASPTALNGRLWSKRWALRTPSISQGSDPTYANFDRPFNGQVFTYTDDKFVNKVDFANSGFRGLTFNLAFNQYGVQNTGNIEVDRRSVENVNQSFPQYKIFINNPDETIYPSGIVGNLVANPLVVDCNTSDVCISYSSTAEGQIEVLLDFDQTSGAGRYDVGTADVLLYQQLVAEVSENTPYERCIPWDGRDGLGNIVNLNTVNIAIHMTLAQGLVNFPAYDVEYIPVGYSVTQIRPVSGVVNKLHYDDVNIPDSPGTGIPQTEINGCTAPCHNYTNQNYGNLNTINTWWFSSENALATNQMSDCILNAYNDAATTSIHTAVNIDVTANDTGDNLDPSTVSTTGVLQPANGIITNINPTTGAITYLPNPGFLGTDNFQYIVCDNGGTPCDTAQVTVTIECAIVAGQNIISGTVFKDVNESGTFQNGEAGDAGITVLVYEDNNQNGLVDGGDTQRTTVDTDVNGNFSVNVTPVFNQTYNYNNTTSGTLAFQTDCNTNLTRTFNVTDNFTISDLNVGLNLTHNYRGDVRVNLTSPAGTTVTLIAQSADADDNYNLLLDDSSTNALDDNVATSPLTPLYEANRTAAPSNPLSAFNGQNANGTWTLSFCNTNFSASNGRELTYNSAKLDFTSNSPYQGHYVLEIDQNDLPAGATMTTDNIETAVFTATGQSDCTNYFGYVATVAIANNNGPLCVGDNLQLSETGGDAVSWSWTGPNGFSSTQQNPTINNITAAAAGIYSVTVTDIDNLTASTSTNVVVSVPVATATSTSPACTGRNLQLFETGGDAVSWSWSGPNSFTSIQQNPTISNVTSAAQGTYTVNITDQFGCTATATTIVTVNNGPTAVSATPNSPSCNGGNDGSIDLNISGGTSPYSYNWSNGSITGSGNGTTISGLSPATYNITITDANGCTASTATVLNDAPLLTVSGTGNATTFEGASDGTIDLNIQNGNPNYTVSWTGPQSGSDTATAAGAFTISGLRAGGYNIFITDVNGCTASTTVTIIDSTCILETATISIIKN